MIGKIIKQISNDYTVKVDNNLYVCKARGKFRNMKLTPLVGDYVSFDENTLYILDIKTRKNSLIRPSVSNVDIAVIVTSVKKPDFDSNLIINCDSEGPEVYKLVLEVTKQQGEPKNDFLRRIIRR